MLAIEARAEVVMIARRLRSRTANCTAVAARNIPNAMAPAGIRLVTPSRPVSRAGPSESTNEVAVIPGANTPMPRARARPRPAGTRGMRTQASLRVIALRGKGIRTTATIAVSSSAASSTNTVTVGAGSVSDTMPDSSGPTPAPKTMAQEASSAAAGFRCEPATSVTAAIAAETAAPTAMPVHTRAAISAATPVAVAKITQASTASPNAGSSTGLRPQRSEATPDTSSEPSRPAM